MLIKAKSCLEELQDSRKSSDQLAAVINKATHPSNKENFEKGEPSNQKLRQKKAFFSESKNVLTHNETSK